MIAPWPNYTKNYTTFIAIASAPKLSDAVSVSFSKASSSSRLDLDVPFIPLLASDVGADAGTDASVDADAMRLNQPSNENFFNF